MPQTAIVALGALTSYIELADSGSVISFRIEPFFRTMVVLLSDGLPEAVSSRLEFGSIRINFVLSSIRRSDPSESVSALSPFCRFMPEYGSRSPSGSRVMTALPITSNTLMTRYSSARFFRTKPVTTAAAVTTRAAIPRNSLLCSNAVSFIATLLSVKAVRIPVLMT